MSEVWPETPMTYFSGRSPRQVARSGKDDDLAARDRARPGAVRQKAGAS